MSGLGVIVPGLVTTFGNRSKRAFRSIGSIVANITVRERHVDELQITDHPIEQGANISDHAFKRPEEVTIECSWTNSSQLPITGLLNDPTASLLGSFILGQGANIGVASANKAIGGSGLPVEIGTALEQVGQVQALSSFATAVNSGTGTGTSLVNDVYDQLRKLQISAVPMTIYTGKRRYDNMLITRITVETDRKSENALNATLVCRQVILVQTQTVSVSAPQVDQANPQSTNAPVNNGTVQVVPVTDNRVNVILQDLMQ